MSKMAFLTHKTTNEESKASRSKPQSVPSESPWLCPSNTLPYQPEAP